MHQIQREASEWTRSTFLDQTCMDLLLCQKKITLYPREHPQVRATLEDLRRAITQLADEEHGPAVMETILIEDLAHCRAESATGSPENYASLARLLKLHLIEEVRFEHTVSDEELYQFACLLRADFGQTPESLEHFDPCGWTSIGLQFYTPQDFPDDLAAGDTLLGRAAGLSRSREVDDLLSQLPPMLAARVRQALVKPAFLRKVCELRRRLKAKQPDFEGNEDLISRALKEILPGLAGSEAESASAEEVLIRVDEYIRSVELEIDAREGAPVERYAPRVDESDFDILPVQHVVPREATERATDLRRVFGVNSSSEATRVLPPDEESDKDSEPAAPPIRQQPSRDTERSNECSLENLFRGIEYDRLTWDAELDHQDELLQYLRVVLELLLDPSCRKVIGRNSTAVLESLTSEMNGADFMEKVVAEVVGFSSTRKITSTDDLLSMLLDAVDSTARIEGMLEDSVIPQSRDLATRTVDRLIERRPKRALEILMLLHRHPAPAIHGHAEAALLSLSKNPALLESWAREYPGGLVDPGVFSQIVERDSPERLIAAFRELFTHAPPETSLRLLRLITPELPGVDLILIAAIQFGPPEVHDYALSFLADSCVPVVTGTLIQTVRLNNYQERPSMREVETALDALVKIDEPRAKQFLKEVETSRSGWLRYEYRREIREALQRMLEREGRN